MPVRLTTHQILRTLYTLYPAATWGWLGLTGTGTDGQKKYNSIERQREGNFSPERLKVGNISFLKNCPAERPREGLGNSWDEQIGMYHAVWFARKNIHSGITCSLCSIAIGCCKVTWTRDGLLLEEISISGDTRQHVSYRLLSIKTADFFFLYAFMKIQTSTRKYKVQNISFFHLY